MCIRGCCSSTHDPQLLPAGLTCSCTTTCPEPSTFPGVSHFSRMEPCSATPTHAQHVKQVYMSAVTVGCDCNYIKRWVGAWHMDVQACCS
jgi:hypothetical protein